MIWNNQNWLLYSDNGELYHTLEKQSHSLDSFIKLWVKNPKYLTIVVDLGVQLIVLNLIRRTL